MPRSSVVTRVAVLGPIGLSLLAILAGSLRVQGQSMEGSPHDFSGPRTLSVGPKGEDIDPCVLCHPPPPRRAAPPRGTEDRPDAWESGPSIRQVSYRMYDSPTMDMPRPAGPTGTSRACLACHDGVVAPQALGDESLIVGTDLSDDHPISIEYRPEKDRGLRSIEDVEAAGLKLFNQGGAKVVECATCHDPHGKGQSGSYLRKDNDRSGLCLGCHDK